MMGSGARRRQRGGSIGEKREGSSEGMGETGDTSKEARETGALNSLIFEGEPGKKKKKGANHPRGTVERLGRRPKMQRKERKKNCRGATPGVLHKKSTIIDKKP